MAEDYINTKQMNISGTGAPVLIKKSEIQVVEMDKSTGLSWVTVANRQIPIVINYHDLVKQLQDTPAPPDKER